MTSTAPTQRKIKSFRGCKACKLAKKKCSEDRPACNYCRRRGFNCEYDVSSLIRFEHFKPQDKDTDSPQESQLASTCISPPSPSRSTSTASSPFTSNFIRNRISTTSSDSADARAVDCSRQLLHPPMTPLIVRQPKIPDFQIDSLDQTYFNFFLSELSGVLAYSNLFPTIVTSTFSRATQSPTLMHTVLSVSSHIADKSLGRPLTRSYLHKKSAISLLQNAISSTKIDEGTIIAVFLMAWNDIVSGEKSARHHLQGLYLLLQQFQDRARQASSDVSPMMMLVWRIAIRHDYLLAMFSKDPPVFPSISSDQDDLHKQWIEKILISPNPNDQSADWALAHFALDNLIHKACHLAKRSIQLRRSPTYDVYGEYALQAEIMGLQKDHRLWLTRPVVQKADLVELLAQDTSVTTSGRFQHYPPLTIKNKFYSSLRSHWDSIGIYISLIAQPFIIPTAERVQSAVSICRAHAALGAGYNVTSSGKVVWLFLAAVAFGKDLEAQWVAECLGRVRQVFPKLREMAARILEVVDIQDDFWNGFERVLDSVDDGLLKV